MLTMGGGLVRAAHPRYRHLDERLTGPESRHGLGAHFDNVRGADNDTPPGQLFGHGISEANGHATAGLRACAGLAAELVRPWAVGK